MIDSLKTWRHSLGRFRYVSILHFISRLLKKSTSFSEFWEHWAIRENLQMRTSASPARQWTLLKSAKFGNQLVLLVTHCARALLQYLFLIVGHPNTRRIICRALPTWSFYLLYLFSDALWMFKAGVTAPKCSLPVHRWTVHRVYYTHAHTHTSLFDLIGASATHARTTWPRVCSW